MRVLVLGGTGFIGSPTVRHLVARGHEVAVLHRGHRASRPPPGVAGFTGDRVRLGEVAGRLRAWRPDAVVDFLAFAESDVSPVLATFRGVARRLVVLSSLDVYRAYDRMTRWRPGPPDPVPLGEDAPLYEAAFPRRPFASGPGDPLWSYDKVLVERAAWSERELAVTVLRLPAVFGPGDERRHRVGHYLARMDAHRGPLAIDESLSRWRWTRGYVEDVAEAVAIASVDARAERRTYNVGEEDPAPEGEWVRAIARVAGHAGRVFEARREDLPPDLARSLDARDFAHDVVMDTTRIRTELGWRPRVAPEDALAASIAWERASGGRPPAAPASVE